MSEKYFVGNDITSFSDNGKYKPISRVTLLVDDENSLTAGDDTGMEIVASCPHATQSMVNSLLQTMMGYQYQAYEAGAANIDPAAELGDGVTVGGVYSPLSKIIDNGRGYADISSPGEMEMEDEYPSEGYIAQEFNRKIAETRSAITKSAEEINLEIQGVDGRVSSLQLTLDGVTVTGQDGVTRINGGMIQANSVTATQIDATNLKVAAANITGTLTASQIQTSSIYVGNLADGKSYATKTYVLNNAGLNASEVNNAIATYIDETSITAETLRGRTVELLASSNTAIGSMELVYTSTGYGVAINTTYGGIKLQSAGNIFLSAGSGGNLTLQNNTLVLGQCNILLSNNSFGIGAPSGAGSPGQLYFQLVS